MAKCLIGNSIILIPVLTIAETLCVSLVERTENDIKMKEKFKILFLAIFISLTNFAQELKTFDKEIITTETKLNLISSKKRGIVTEKKEIYFVESDNQTIS